MSGAKEEMNDHRNPGGHAAPQQEWRGRELRMLRARRELVDRIEQRLPAPLRHVHVRLDETLRMRFVFEVARHQRDVMALRERLPHRIIGRGAPVAVRTRHA